MKTKYTAIRKPQEDQQKMWAVRHEWGGEKVHRLVLDLSGFYVKSAQILATKAVSSLIWNLIVLNSSRLKHVRSLLP